MVGWSQIVGLMGPCRIERWQGALLQPLLARAAYQHGSLLEPVSQHDTAGRLTVEREIVNGGSVGVTMDKQLAAVLAQQCVHRRWRHIHDGLALLHVFHLALTTHLAGDGEATSEGQVQEEPAQPCELGDAAKFLIAQIQGAEQIAVAQQHPLPIEVDHARISQQCHA